MGIRWTETHGFVLHLALFPCAVELECPFGEQSRGPKHSMEMQRFRFVFRVVLVNFLQLVVEIILQVLDPLLWLGLT